MADCHKCPHKVNQPGDCHIGCGHEVVMGNAMHISLIVLSGNSHELKPILGFDIDPHAIANGWGGFPFNYDPIWLRGECELLKLENELGEQNDRTGKATGNSEEAGQ